MGDDVSHMSGKSFVANLEEIILRFTKPAYMDSKDKIEDFIREKATSQVKLPKGIFKSRDFNGLNVFTFGDENAHYTILFVHGGAYINEINYQHLLYCFKLSKSLDAHVIAPVYGLAPNHNAMECLDAIEKVYRGLIAQNRNIILMGDSAGGGFALSFCQHLKEIDLPQPEKIIVFSPWVDVSMDNPPYDNENDPILGEIGLREIGRSWAGDLDMKDYRVSPLYGVNNGLPRTLVFVGGNEIFYRDIIKYVDNLKRDCVDVELIVGGGLFHIYPLFPSPEARNAFKEVKKEIIG